MKTLANVGLAVGVISLLIGIVLRIAAKQIALGLEPSSFLELSVASFLLTIAINTAGNK